LSRYKTKNQSRKVKKSFPIWIVLGGVGLLLVALFAFLSGSKSGDSSKNTKIEVTGASAIKVDQEVIDYGKVKLGLAPIRTVFTVTNVGDQTLVFSEAPYFEVLEGC